jgi:hypothetical protein
VRTLVLHIGAPKTGTTAIQSFLTRNQRLLETEYDISIPNPLSYSRAARMYVYATQKMSPRKRAKLRVKSLDEFNREYEEQISDLADSVRAPTAICSNELLFGLRKPDVERLKHILSSVFSSFHVILYLRRQDLLETAAYLQAYKGGYDRIGAFKAVLKRRRPGYSTVIRTWSTALGSENVRTFLYDDIMRQDRDIIGHFMRALGVDDISEFSPAVRNNVSWGLHQAYAASAIRQGCKDAPFERIKAFVETIEPGPRYPVRRAEAEAFYRSFAEENEIIRARYFPEKTSLFEEDFSMYPETFEIEAAKSKYSATELLRQYNAGKPAG